MLYFPILRIRSLELQLRELSVAQSIALAAMPPHLEQAGATAFLRAATQSATGAAGSDPLHWTVQQRTLAVAHYLSVVSDDGPDFAIGAARYSDYLDAAADHPHEPRTPHSGILGEVGGDTWSIRHLTGAMAESVERLIGEVRDAHDVPLPVRLHWTIGAMAAQLVRYGDDAAPSVEDGAALDAYLLLRMQTLAQYPESDFSQLLNLFFIGQEKLHHLLRIGFGDEGIVVLPRENVKEAGGALLPPARFPVHALIGTLAIGFAKKSL